MLTLITCIWLYKKYVKACRELDSQGIAFWLLY